MIRGNIQAIPYSAISPRRANVVLKRLASEARPQIAIESDNQTKANHWPVDGGKHRLPDRREIRVFLLKIRGRAFTAVGAVAQNLLAAPVIQIPVIQAAFRHRAQQRHVSACAKATPSACQYDHADLVALLGAFHVRTHFAFHQRRPGVEFVRPIQSNRGHSIGYVIERLLSWHDARLYRISLR
jgi:hypothetical protein